MKSMDILELLNDEQKKAVITDAQKVRVIAGAGSGKTRVLTNRIAYLIDHIGVPAKRIIAFTFTNKAAEEMLKRVKTMVNSNDEQPTLQTFHAFGAKFLRFESKAINVAPNFIIFDDEDSKALIKNLCVEEGYERSDDFVKDTIKYISYNKSKGYYAHSHTIRANGPIQEKDMLLIWQKYEARKKVMGCFDFDDLINETILILEQFPEINKKWKRRFDHILVDEFQDTNDVQMRLLNLLLAPTTALYVVGDPDQTIYSWRGANEKIILNFERDYNAETIILDQNYRSTQHILNTANKLIAHNKERVPKNLYTANQEGEPVVLQHCEGEFSEPHWIYSQVHSLLLNKQDFSLRDAVILLRANHLTLPFEKYFMRHNINYQIYGGLKFYQRREVKDAIAYFRLLVNDKDDISFERIANVPRRGLGKVAMNQLKAIATANNQSMIEVIRNDIALGLSQAPKLELIKLVNIIDEIKEKMGNEDFELSALMNEYLQKAGYYDFILSIKEDEKQDTMRANVKELLNDVQSFARVHPNASFLDYLENATLLSAQDEVMHGDFITMMTVHMAKGLEYDYVFVAGLNQGVFPNERAVVEGGRKALEEERRLCYVAFTRAKKRLYVTTNQNYNFALGSSGIPSIFIKEAGLEEPKYKKYREIYGKPVREKIIDNVPYFGDAEPSGFQSDFPFSVNDIVEHIKFGEGLIIGVYPNEAIIDVKFNDGTRKLKAFHPSIKKKD